MLGEVLDGLEANSRDIGASIVLGAGTFGEGPAASFAERGGALDHSVGALDGFDGDDIEVADSEGLSDVESEEFGEEGPDEVDVGFLCGGGLGEGHDAGLGELAFDRDG